MKITIQRENLLKPLQLVCGVVERKQTLPILSNILVRAGKEGLSLTATDLEIEMVTNTPFDGSSATETTLPARKFLDICRTLPEQAQVELTIDGERAVIRSGKSRFTLATLPASDFPNIGAFQETAGFSITQSILKKLIERTQFAMAQQDIRYYLNGLLLELSPGRVRAVATDGHRLALCDAPTEVEINETLQIIVPRKGVHELTRLLEDSDRPVQIHLGSNHIRLSSPDMSFTSKLIDGRFPDYQRVVPEGGDKIVIADKETLKQALVRASILSNEKYRSVRFLFTEGNLRIFAHNPEQEEAEEEVAVDYSGEKLEIGFNVNYVVDALSAVTTPQVRLILSDANSCCLIQAADGENCKYVVMPMRL